MVDSVLKRFQPQIFTLLAKHQDCFKLERIISQSQERNPGLILERFLNRLGFENATGKLEITHY